MFDLGGMTALVTGASGGIGSAIAAALTRQGARVAVSGTREDALRSVAERLAARRDPRLRWRSLAVDALVPRAIEGRSPARKGNNAGYPHNWRCDEG